MFGRSLCVLFALVPALAFADAKIPTQDLKGSADPAGLGRYEGSFIVEYQKGAYDEVTLPLSILEEVKPEQRDTKNNMVYAPKQKLDLEGKLTRTVYLLPEGRTPLEVLRNYQQMVTDKGGELLYECKADACGGDIDSHASHGGGRTGVLNYVFPASKVSTSSYSNAACAVDSNHVDQRYLVAKLAGSDVETHAAVMTYTLKDDLYCKAFNERTIAIVVTVEAKPREQKMVTVKASELATAIAKSGKVALYGIYFDFDKADLKPESKPQLDEISTLLKNDAALKLMVVGHTDNKGGAAYNLDLSKRRADAVVAALGSDGIATDRLLAQGMGSAAPVASNDSDEGRAKNRRVELVKQ
jgi:outer membrane protein OmpA-like peptidoglycan-associated protein